MSAATVSRRQRRIRAATRRAETENIDPLNRITSIVSMLGVPVRDMDVKTMFTDECKNVPSTNIQSAINLICSNLYTNRAEMITSADIRGVIKDSIVLESSARAVVGMSIW